METNFFPGGDTELHAQGEHLFRFAVSRVGNQSVAQDLVQETFLAAIKSRDRFRGESCPRAWLFGILRHKIIDYFRQKHREAPPLPDLSSAEIESNHPAALGLANLSHSPSQQLEFIEFRRALASALDRLPPRSARAFQLYEVEGQPGTAVCTQLQISPANLWVTLHRTRKKLSEELSSWNTAKS